MIGGHIGKNSSQEVGEVIVKDLQLPEEEIVESIAQLIETATVYETKLGYIHKKKYEEVLEKLKK